MPTASPHPYHGSMIENRAFYDSLPTDRLTAFRDVASYPDGMRRIHATIKTIEREHFASRSVPLRWADVGCGIGGTYEIARSLGYGYLGVDCSAANIAACREAHPDGAFVHADWLDLPDVGLFDLVSFVSTLHHFEDWRGAVDRALSLLRPGGVLYVEHEFNPLYAILTRAFAVTVKRANSREMREVEIHWFRQLPIDPAHLPPGRTEYHCDFVPIFRHLGLRWTHSVGRLLPEWRKVVLRP